MMSHDLQCGRFSIIAPALYCTSPQVILWLSELDFGRECIYASTSEINCDGFVAHIDTWDDTVLHSAAASWITISSDRPNMLSRSFYTSDIRSQTPQQLVTQGTVDFNKTFPRAPRVGGAHIAGHRQL